MDYLQELGVGARKRVLDGLPPTLNETYDRIRRGQVSGAHNASTRNIARKTLHCICSVGGDISIAGLCLAVSIDHSKDSIDSSEVVSEAEVLHACSSLARKNTLLNKLELAHFSVKGYLQDIDPNGPLGEFSHSKEIPSTWLASTCIRYLMFKKFRCHTRNDSDGWLTVKQRRCGNFSYAFAAKSWQVLNEPIEGSSLQPSEHLRLLLDPRRKPYLQNWLVQYLVDEYGRNHEKETFLRATANAIRQDFTPLHVAASFGLQSICSWLLGVGVSVNAKSNVGPPLACVLAGPRVFLDGPTRIATLYNKTASPRDVGATVGIRIEYEIDLAAASTDVSFSGRALHLCQKRVSALPLIPFTRRPGAISGDIISIIVDSNRIYDEQAMHDIFQEIS